ncbi:uncharacterized protein [Temnothorax nylanderi]|uniref:uncharacterized protein n=1 Tax=Temnothorax nylanderi TaxID=102681 RepID=UPI003A85E4C5
MVDGQQKKYGRGYKNYLHSCNIDDVSPRVLRRLNSTLPTPTHIFEIDSSDNRNTNENITLKINENMETEHVDENILDIIRENNNTEVVNRIEEAFFKETDTTDKDEIHCTRNEFMELDTDLINDLRDESSEKNVNQSRNLQDLVLNKDFQDCIDISPNKSPACALR